MKLDKVEILLQKYYEGQTSLEEERLLCEFFQKNKELPSHLQSHAAAFGYYNEMQKDNSEFLCDEEKLFKRVERKGSQAKNVVVPLFTFWKLAAGIALILTGYWAGTHFKMGNNPSQHTEISELRQEIQEMRALLEQNPFASERISLVSQDFTIDDEILEVLAHTMNTDNSVNVRLAACQALFRLGDYPSIRRIFVSSLPQQIDPLMQITLIEMLVDLNEKSAIGAFEDIIIQENILPIVKDKAEEGLSILI